MSYLRGLAMTTATSSRITKTPGVCGGDACVEGHRIPVWSLVRLRQLVADDAKVLKAFPTITAADLDAAWEYNDAHREEIERNIRENEEGEDGLVEW
jgi:uncharacterized protein (DUF433 family)